MATTRLIVDLANQRTGQAGLLEDVQGLVDLVYKHNGAIEGLEDTGNNSDAHHSRQDTVSEGLSAPRGSVAEKLPQV